MPSFEPKTDIILVERGIKHLSNTQKIFLQHWPPGVKLRKKVTNYCCNRQNVQVFVIWNSEYAIEKRMSIDFYEENHIGIRRTRSNFNLKMLDAPYSLNLKKYYQLFDAELR